MSIIDNPTDNSIDTVLDPDAITVLGRDEGPHFHFLDNLATVKATAGDTGALTAVEFVAPKGFGPPVHVHRDEDELVLVLEGEVAFRSGDTEVIAGPGSTAYLPHGVPHTFQVLTETARMTSVTASVAGSPRFDRFVSAVGDSVDQATMPAPAPVDPAHLGRMCDEFGMDVVGPPPGPLAD